MTVSVFLGFWVFSGFLSFVFARYKQTNTIKVRHICCLFGGLNRWYYHQTSHTKATRSISYNGDYHVILFVNKQNAHKQTPFISKHIVFIHYRIESRIFFLTKMINILKVRKRNDSSEVCCLLSFGGGISSPFRILSFHILQLTQQR